LGSKRTDSTTRRRQLEVRKERLRVLDARELDAIAGGGHDGVFKSRHEDNRGASRYCLD